MTYEKFVPIVKEFDEPDERIVPTGAQTVAVIINNSVDDKAIYEATRKAWKIADAKIPGISHVVPAVGDKLSAPYKVEYWYPVGLENGQKRWAFVGEVDYRKQLSLMDRLPKGVRSYGSAVIFLDE